jgi:hypothetical protein
MYNDPWMVINMNMNMNEYEYLYLHKFITAGYASLAENFSLKQIVLVHKLHYHRPEAD